MRNKPQLIVGVDNGVTGALCSLDVQTGSVSGYARMPLEVCGGLQEVCIPNMLLWIEELGRSVVVAIEEPLRHAPSSQSMRSMSISFGKTVGALEARGIPVVRIQVKEWQNEMLGKRLAKGMTKPAALLKARFLWPAEDWLASPLCRTPHDGIVDAALIAQYHLNTLP